jgi:hypothetical protein
METQNVSAQLYFKQLPQENLSFCDNPGSEYLSTCVNNVATDVQLENTFQKQLDLSEIFKSPEMFEKIKKNFSDQTMEEQVSENPVQQPEPPSIESPFPPAANLFSKETFGDMDSNPVLKWMCVIIIFIVFIAGLIFAFYKM